MDIPVGLTIHSSLNINVSKTQLTDNSRNLIINIFTLGSETVWLMIFLSVRIYCLPSYDPRKKRYNPFSSFSTSKFIFVWILRPISSRRRQIATNFFNSEDQHQLGVLQSQVTSVFGYSKNQPVEL